MDESYVYPASMRYESAASINGGWDYFSLEHNYFSLEHKANGVLHADNVPAKE
jgi:hypothetical protein